VQVPTLAGPTDSLSISSYCRLMLPGGVNSLNTAEQMWLAYGVIVPARSAVPFVSVACS